MTPPGPSQRANIQAASAFVTFTLTHPAAVKMLGEQLGQLLLAPCCGPAGERTLRRARSSLAVLTAVSDSGLLWCLSCPWGMSQAHPAPLPLLSNLSKNSPITFEGVRIGRVLRRVLKMSEAPLLSFVAVASSNSE